MNPILFNIQHFSLHDGPGIRTVLFFKGCPLNCIWCHNPEGKSIAKTLSFLREHCVSCGKCALVCPVGAHTFENGEHRISRGKCTKCGKCAQACNFGSLEMIGKEYTVEGILSEVEKDSAYYGKNGGVTISGGEPFMQFQALITLLKGLKEKGYHICIETSGFTTHEKISEAAKYTDMFLFDYKESGNDRYLKYTGVKQDEILKNLDALDSLNAEVILRCPIIPGINDYEKHLKKIAETANKHTCVNGIELMPYHPLGIAKAENIGEEYSYDNSAFAEAELMEKCCEMIKRHTCKNVGVSK